MSSLINSLSVLVYYFLTLWLQFFRVVEHESWVKEGGNSEKTTPEIFIFKALETCEYARMTGISFGDSLIFNHSQVRTAKKQTILLTHTYIYIYIHIYIVN